MVMYLPMWCRDLFHVIMSVLCGLTALITLVVMIAFMTIPIAILVGGAVSAIDSVYYTSVTGNSSLTVDRWHMMCDTTSCAWIWLTGVFTILFICGMVCHSRRVRQHRQARRLDLPDK